MKPLNDVFISYQEKQLDEALTFDDSHICKRGATEIVEFYLQSVESSEFFRGVLDVDVSVVKATPSDSNNNTEHTSSHPIMVELEGRMAGTSQIEKREVDAEVLFIFLSVHISL